MLRHKDATAQPLRKTNPAQQAYHAILYLKKSLAILSNIPTSFSTQRDQALKILDDMRNSDLYESIEAKLGSADLSDYEYIFYALVTDNVNTVDPDKLEKVIDANHFPHTLYRNLSILVAALRFSHAITKTEIEKHHKEFSRQLCLDLHAENAVRPAFLNLAGICLNGIDFTKIGPQAGLDLPSLSFADLRGTQFTDCNFHFLRLHFSDISHAIFTRISNNNSGFNLYDCIARSAQFTHVDVHNIVWTNSDFRAACFKYSTIGYGRFTESNFSDAVFSHSTLALSSEYPTHEANFTNADFTTAKIGCSHYSTNKFTSTRFIRPCSADNLYNEISRITNEFFEEFNAHRLVGRELATFKKIIAADVERHIQTLFMTAEEKFKLLQNVMQHDLFHYQYIDSLEALVVGPFPRPEKTWVFFAKYDDEKNAGELGEASLKTYKTLYAYGMTLLKRFADAVSKPEELDQYIQEIKSQVLDKMSQVSDYPNFKQEMPSYMHGLAAEELLEKLIAMHKEEKLVGLNEKLNVAYSLSKLLFALYCVKRENEEPTLNQSKIKNAIGGTHPIFNLKYYEETNCLAPSYFSDPGNGIHHSAADLIKEFTNETRLMPAAAKSAVCAVSGTLFNKSPANGNNEITKEKNERRMDTY